RLDAAALPRRRHSHRIAELSGLQRRPRSAAHDRRRGDGEDSGPAHGQDDRARLVQPGPSQPRLSGGPGRLDRPDRLGEPVARSGLAGPKIPRFVAFSFWASDFWGPSWSLHLVSSQSCSALSWQSLYYGLSRYRSASDRRGGEASKW